MRMATPKFNGVIAEIIDEERRQRGKEATTALAIKTRSGGSRSSNGKRCTHCKIECVNDEPVVVFDAHGEVIDNPRGPEYKRMYTFVTTPILMPHPFQIPRRITVDLDSGIIAEILRPLRDGQKRDFTWGLGRAISGTDRRPCVVILYGKDSHEGKGEFAKNIMKLFELKVAEGGDRDGAAAKWIIICDERNIEDGMNNDNVKRWTSDSPVQADGMSAYLFQMIIGLTNTMGFCKRDAISNSMGRRIVVYRMEEYAASPKDVIDNMVRMKMIAMSLWYSSVHREPPM
ncbi:hypothetical protein GP486_005639 [Trichoglossum hirsutum]|uniref:Uncharacterized protein n=1 Tax=Trichoglossum hirsutum TaxID=265104 RepID=A0A9P8RMC3_9PEZI|nr:hypothetical protein GP486_005639 [Trichoglossum hirsutum]